MSHEKHLADEVGTFRADCPDCRRVGEDHPIRNHFCTTKGCPWYMIVRQVPAVMIEPGMHYHPEVCCDWCGMTLARDTPGFWVGR